MIWFKSDYKFFDVLWSVHGIVYPKFDPKSCISLDRIKCTKMLSASIWKTLTFLSSSIEILKNVMNDFFFKFCQGNSLFFVLTVQFYLYFVRTRFFFSLFTLLDTSRLCHLRKIITMFENKTYNNENKLDHQ